MDKGGSTDDLLTLALLSVAAMGLLRSRCEVFPCVGVEVQASICPALNDAVRQRIHRYVGRLDDSLRRVKRRLSMSERLRHGMRAEVLDHRVIGQQDLVRRFQLDQLRTHSPLPFSIFESRLCDLFFKLLMKIKH